MRFSDSYKRSENFFAKRHILSELQSRFFVLEEGALLLLIVLQLYFISGITILGSGIYFLGAEVALQNVLWLAGSVLFFAIGYVVVGMRDTTVGFIHQHFWSALFGAAKAKTATANRQSIVFVLGELVFATVIAISILLYLDPEVNIIPAPFNYIAFLFFLGVSLLLFSHTKQFREIFYGPTLVQKRIHHGHELRRITNTRRRNIRIGLRSQQRKSRK